MENRAGQHQGTQLQVRGRMDWRLQKNHQSFLFLLRRIRSFSLWCNSVIFLPALKEDDANRLNTLILGMEPGYLVAVSEGRMLRKLLCIMDKVSHPLHATLLCSFCKTPEVHCRTPQELLPFCRMDS